ncbi:MAG: hypothetical protein AB7E80_05630 [Hyphomicrobiaceae bacterium]
MNWTKMLAGAAAVIAGTSALCCLGSTTAYAINCDGPYQITSAGRIATPYCEDNYLARVAREYGSRVSNAEIRNNPNRKAETCLFMGHDTRVSHICDSYRNSVGSPRY